MNCAHQKIMQQRAFDNPKISFLWNSTVTEIKGTVETGVTGVVIQDTVSKETREESCDGIFMAIGHFPNTSLFENILDLDKKKYIITQNGSTITNISGVFACGDVQDSYYRQAITAAGSGCMAAIDAERFLENEAHH